VYAGNNSRLRAAARDRRQRAIPFIDSDCFRAAHLSILRDDGVGCFLKRAAESANRFFVDGSFIDDKLPIAFITYACSIFILRVRSRARAKLIGSRIRSIKSIEDIPRKCRCNFHFLRILASRFHCDFKSFLQFPRVESQA